MLSKTLFLNLVFFPSLALCAEVYIFEYIVKEEKNFSKILKEFIKKGETVRANDPGTVKTLQKYPNKDWSKLRAGEKFDLHITKSKANLSTINNYLNSLSPKGELLDSQALITRERKIRKKKPSKKRSTNKKIKLTKKPISKKRIKKNKKRFKKNLFYVGAVLSRSVYEELLENKIDVDYEQNSLAGLIFGYKRYLKNRRYSIKTDFKISLHQDGKITGNYSGEKSISPEVTNQTHFMYRPKRSNFYLLGGLKYMKFATFDLEKNYQSSSSFELINHNIISVQIGTSYLFRSFNKISTLELLASNKIFHISDYNSDLLLDMDLTYTIVPIKKTKIFASYSYLAMNGDTKVSRHRATLGFAYFFL